MISRQAGREDCRRQRPVSEDALGGLADPHPVALLESDVVGDQVI